MLYTILMTQTFPQEHDEKIAAAEFELMKARQKVRQIEAQVMSEAGFHLEFRGKWNEGPFALGAAAVYEPKTFSDAMKKLDNNSPGIQKHGKALVECVTIHGRIDELERQYEGWSRFFLVTSSPGHIHSSLGCSTCRNTTTYGWLPELSGKTEAETVKELGPALCTVCFPSAPVEDTGYKITASRAQELAWSPDRAEKIAQREAREQIKIEKKTKKEANALKYAESLADKVNKLIDMFGDDIKAEYEWTWSNKGYDNAHYVHNDMLRRK